MIEITEAPVARTESPYISAYEAFVIEDKQSKRIIRYYKKVRSDEYYDWYVTIEPNGRIGLVRFADKTLKSEVFGLGEKYRTREVKTLNVDVTCSLGSRHQNINAVATNRPTCITCGQSSDTFDVDFCSERNNGRVYCADCPLVASQRNAGCGYAVTCILRRVA